MGVRVDTGSDAAPLVLVVDDDRDVRRLLEAALTVRGIRVASAENGQVGIDLIVHETPRLIVLDYWMPVMDGAAFMRRLDGLLVRRPPVILFTAIEDDPGLARELGVDVYVQKPIELSRFIKLCEAMLRCGVSPEVATPRPQGVERRVFPRRHHRRSVEVRIAGGRAAPAFILDVSEGGLGLELAPEAVRPPASLAPPPGTYVAVTVTLRDGQRVVFDTRVRHSTPSGKVGVEFFALDAVRRRGLSALLDEATG